MHPTAVSVQSDADLRSVQKKPDFQINSSRDNNFNSMEKSLNFRVEENSKSKPSSTKIFGSAKKRLNVEELKLSYVYSSNKKTAELSDVTEGQISRRLMFEKQENLDRQPGELSFPFKTRSFHSTLLEI